MWGGPLSHCRERRVLSYLISSSLTLIYHCYFHTSPWVINHPLTCIMELGGCKVHIDKIVRYHPNHIHIKFPVIFLTSPHPSAINASYSICLSVPTHSAWKVLTAWWKLRFCTLYPYTCYVRTAIYAVKTQVLLILSFSTGEANKFLTCCLKSLCILMYKIGEYTVLLVTGIRISALSRTPTDFTYNRSP